MPLSRYHPPQIDEFRIRRVEDEDAQALLRRIFRSFARLASYLKDLDSEVAKTLGGSQYFIPKFNASGGLEDSLLSETNKLLVWKSVLAGAIVSLVSTTGKLTLQLSGDTPTLEFKDKNSGTLRASIKWQGDEITLEEVGSGSIVVGADHAIKLGDAAGVNKVSVKDSGDVEVAAIDSNGNISPSGTVDGRDVAADGTTLDGLADSKYAVHCQRITTDQTISDSTTTAIAFNGEIGDDDGDLHDNSTNPERIVAKKAGWWLFSYQVRYAANAAGVRICWMRKNGSGSGSDIFANKSDNALGGGIAHTITGGMVVHMDLNDYVEVMVYQTSTGNLDVLKDLTQFSAALIYPD